MWCCYVILANRHKKLSVSREVKGQYSESLSLVVMSLLNIEICQHSFLMTDKYWPFRQCSVNV